MKRRRGTIEKKIRLTSDGLDAVGRWADQNNVSFSAAIETLVRLGLGEPAATALTPALTRAIQPTLASDHARLAALIAYTVIESDVAASCM